VFWRPRLLGLPGPDQLRVEVRIVGIGLLTRVPVGVGRDQTDGRVVQPLPALMEVVLNPPLAPFCSLRHVYDLGASHGAAVFVSADELRQWPVAAVAAMKAQKLLVKARPAVSVVCPGCERECVMPIHVVPPQGTAPRAFIVCDKRRDINRVAVPISRLEQWQACGASIAGLLAQLLDLRRPGDIDSDAGRWEIGMLKDGDAR
jgi:hypothetical protein